MEKSNVLTLAGALLLTVGISSLGGFFTFSEIAGWYGTLQKPSFHPPNWLFAPVWTLLYILMGIALYLVWKQPSSPERNAALRAFMLQFILNCCWSFIFFRLHQVASALFEIVLMWLLIVITILRFRKVSGKAAWLLVPYLCWVGFAMVLNAAIWKLNYS